MQQSILPSSLEQQIIITSLWYLCACTSYQGAYTNNLTDAVITLLDKTARGMSHLIHSNTMHANISSGMQYLHAYTVVMMYNQVN